MSIAPATILFYSQQIMQNLAVRFPTRTEVDTVVETLILSLFFDLVSQAL